MAYEDTFCLPTYEWSPLPACDFRSQCKRQKLPEKLHFLSPACKNSKAYFCKVACKVRVFSLNTLRTSHEMVFIKDIHCAHSGEWRGLPDCGRAEKLLWDERIKKWQCGKPKLDKHSVIQGSCSYIEGSICRYKCKSGFFSKGNYTIKCLKKQWHGFHKCDPLLCPNLPDIYELKNNCPPVAHSVCEAGCRVGELVGKSTIFCNPSGHWSALPLCVPSHTCPRKISTVIKFVSKCTFKLGEKCQVRCQGRLVLVGSHLIICEKGKWQDLPECFPENETPYKPVAIKCHFPPRLNGNLEIIGSCEPVGGMSCDIRCRDKSALMAGPNATTCLPPGLWSSVKPCTGGKSYCSAPNFYHVIMIEDCSGKEVGSTCQVSCKHRLSMKFSIICTNEVKWSTPPNCTCPAPVLKEGVKLRENCGSKQVGQKCNVKCKSGFKMVGRGDITCNKILRWSSSPLCKKIICPKPKLTNVLLFKEDCTSIQSGKTCSLECKEGGKILHHDKINCIEGKSWSKLPFCACPPPDLDEDIEIKNNCNEKSPGQKCFLSCKRKLFLIGTEYMVCQNNTRWSKAPLCKRKFCHKPTLTNMLIFDEDCTSKEPGERCRMACKNEGSLVGPTFLTCSNTTRWSPMPSCSCPPPSLPGFLETKENCRRKLPGQSCALSCTDGLKVEGNAIIKCQDDAHWSQLPKCKENFCIKKQLPRYLVHSTDCSAIQPGEKCFVECKEGGETDGPNFITCIGGSQWTALPKCRCPPPRLSYYLSSTNNCSKKSIGENCNLSCNERRKLVGKNFITCQNSTTWSTQPNCIRNQCTKLKLPSFLLYAEDCSTKLPGDQCRLECAEGGEFIGRSIITCINGTKWSSLPSCACPTPNLNERLTSTEDCSKKLIGQTCFLKCTEKFLIEDQAFIKCQNNTRWSPLPRCSINFCNRPNLPAELSFAEDCTAKVPGESCLLECTERGELIGSNKITCINSTRWGHFPKCTCPPPFLEENLSTEENCHKKLIGEKCRVNCTESFELIGSDFITCQENSRWSSSPSCKKLICPKPQLSRILSFHEDCSSKLLNEKCEIECSEEGEIIGSKFITCNKRGRDLYWTTFPQCTCPEPFLSDELKLLEICHGKKPGEVCKVNCTKKLTILGGNFIHCQNNTKWTNLPKCILNICMKPQLQSILQFQEDCTSKIVGESCLLKCRNGGTLSNSSRIFCSESKRWSPFPKCTCPPITLADNVNFLENCSAKFPGESCRTTCNSFLYKMNSPGPLICKNNSQWNYQPRCRKVFCSQPTLPDYLVFKERCDNTSIGSVCNVSCAEKGRLIGNIFIKCLDGSLWSEFPDCTCSKPVLPIALQSTHNCDFIKRGDRCSVKCAEGLKINGQEFILCQNNTKWSLLPKCVQTLCSAPVIKSNIVKLKEDCSKKTVADKCELACIQGGNIIGKRYIECRSNFQWTTDLPDCTCKTPDNRSSLQLRGNCSNKKRTERCNVACKEGYNIIGQSYIICQNNLTWTRLPQCQIIQCPTPILNNPSVKFNESCLNKTYGAVCYLSCIQGGSLIGNNYIKCTNKSSWSEFPDCRCSPPIFSNVLKSNENCSFIQRGGKCKVECEKNLQLQGNGFILCQNNLKWTQNPVCVKRYCPRPVISNILSIVTGNCSEMTVGEECQVRCRYGGQLMETDRAKCLPNGAWSPFPDCTCKTPTLRSSQYFLQDCTAKMRMESCSIACRESAKYVVEQFIFCKNDTQWTPLPVCETMICPPPVLSILKTEEDCSHKTVEEVCRVSCIEGGRLIGEQNIKCLANLLWSTLPDCFCPSPTLTNEFKLREQDCDSIRRDQKCYLQCTEKNRVLEGRGYILCQPNRKWSRIEVNRCTPLHCPIPNLGGGLVVGNLLLKENCSQKSVGEECEVYCKHGGSLIGRNRITCYSNTTWSSLPDCACPSPILISDLQTKQDCSFKKPGEECEFQCKDENERLQGKSSILCQNSTKWSAIGISRCSALYCPTPNFSEGVLLSKENCSQKREGEECEVYCKHGGVVIGRDRIKCTSGRKWSFWPDCPCPVPQLGENAKTLGNCSMKTRNQKCFIYCAPGSRNANMSIFDTIVCQNNTKWSKVPECVSRLCKTFYSPVIGFVRNSCNNASHVCTVYCRENGTMIGKSQITCLKNIGWSLLPDCTCPPPVLPEYIKLSYDCSFVRRGGVCHLRCDGKDQVTPKNSFIMCQNNTRWSSLPKCRGHCRSPDLTNTSFETVASCDNSEIRGRCYVKCKWGGRIVGQNYITCSSSRKWTGKVGCTCLTLTNFRSLGLYLKEDCMEKRVNQKCEVSCSSDGRQYSLLCSKQGYWTQFPPCFQKYCPKPNLDLENFGIFESENSCLTKGMWERCNLFCRNGGTLRARGFTVSGLMCQATFEWTSTPDCTCPRPTLSKYIEFLEDCSHKEIGEYCLLQCKGEYVISKYYMVCQEKGVWDELPRCLTPYCPLPNLAESTKYEIMEDCKSKGIGETCQLRCRNGGRFYGTDRIKCLGDLSWTAFPECLCPSPLLTAGVILLEDCSSKFPHEYCLLSCEAGGYTDRPYIYCEDDSKWDVVPTCSSRFCPLPTLPEMVMDFQEDCRNKMVGEVCNIICKAGGSANTKTMMCMGDFTWNPFPTCHCPLPTITAELEFMEDCSSKAPGQVCYLKCKNDYKLPKNYITCQENTQWENLPPCVTYVCTTPILPQGILEFGEDCSAKSLGDSCQLRCTRGGQIFDSDRIMCSDNLVWSQLPSCSCPIPTMDAYLEMQDDCTGKKQNEACLIKCNNGYDLPKNYITCLPDTQWEPLPRCVTMICPAPVLPQDILDFAEDCNAKTSGDSCLLRCAKGGRLLGSDRIMCSDNLVWSQLPSCSCPIPTMDAYLEMQEDCSVKNPNEACFIKCNNGYDLSKNYITCLPDTQWEPLPRCVAMICSAPVLPQGVLDFAEDCNAKPSGDSCLLRCAKGGRLLGSDRIMCSDNLVWSQMPSCSCPIPTMDAYLEMQEDCSVKNPNEACFLKCNNGFNLPKNYITCLPDTQWEPLPRCITFVCPIPVLPEGTLGFLEDCNAKQVGQSCRLRCLQGGNVLGSDSITCLTDLTWSRLPLCTCSVPVLTPSVTLREDCSNKRAEEWCQMKCGSHEDAIRCELNGRWTAYPPKCSEESDNKGFDPMQLYYG